MLFDHTATKFSAANALLLAQASQAAYLDHPDAKIKARELGFNKFEWIDLTKWFQGLHAFAASCDTHTVLAFRGTHDAKDWMDDLRATPASFSWLFEGASDVGHVHAGFGHALSDAWEEINVALDAVAPKPPIDSSLKDLAAMPARTFWITGHSLGGALAVLSGAAFSFMPDDTVRPVNGIYTFGQPRVGAHPFCGNYDHILQSKTFRFVNKQDLVPRVPFRGWDYGDLGHMIHFDDSGTPLLQSPQWTNLLSRTFESFKEFFSITGAIKTDVGDHSMDGYAALVSSQAAALDALF